MFAPVDVTTQLLFLAILAVVLALLVPWWVAVVVCLLAAPPLLVASRQIRRALRRRVSVGAEALPGARATVVARNDSPAALPYVVQCNGELWMARSAEELVVGQRALVLGVEENHLILCRLPPELEG